MTRAPIEERHLRAAVNWRPDVPDLVAAEDLHPRDAYAHGRADREAEIAASLRRRDRWGGGAIPDRETANDIERGHDDQWERLRGPND